MSSLLLTVTLAVAAVFSPGDPIYAVFQYSGSDSLGGAFSFALHERMEKSSLYRFTVSDRNSMHPPNVRVEVVTLNVGGPQTGLISTVSLVAIVQCASAPRIAYHALLLVSPGSLEKMVKQSLAEMDEHIVEELRLPCRPVENRAVASTAVSSSDNASSRVSAGSARPSEPDLQPSRIRSVVEDVDSHP